LAGTGIVKRYTNGEVTVVWQPDVCIHSTTCFRGLPAVFDPRRRPWVDIKAAPTAEILAQVKRCPSGALSVEEPAVRDAGRPEAAATAAAVSVEPSPRGPLLVKGAVEVRDAAGAVVRRDGVTAFCRCGASANKPYCDGTHGRVGFEG